MEEIETSLFVWREFAKQLSPTDQSESMTDLKYIYHLLRNSKIATASYYLSDPIIIEYNNDYIVNLSDEFVDLLPPIKIPSFLMTPIQEECWNNLTVNQTKFPRKLCIRTCSRCVTRKSSKYFSIDEFVRSHHDQKFIDDTQLTYFYGSQLDVTKRHINILDCLRRQR